MMCFCKNKANMQVLRVVYVSFFGMCPLSQVFIYCDYHVVSFVLCFVSLFDENTVNQKMNCESMQ